LSKRVRTVNPKELEVVMDRLNFNAIAEFLGKTKGVFIEDLDRRTVPYARRRLEQITGKKITSWAGRDGQRRGYVFQFSTKTVNNKKTQ